MRPRGPLVCLAGTAPGHRACFQVVTSVIIGSCPSSSAGDFG
jgi:hypothetical protein